MLLQFQRPAAAQGFGRREYVARVWHLGREVLARVTYEVTVCRGLEQSFLVSIEEIEEGRAA